ncbi:integrase/recombinase xerD homolog [Rhinophrynus dorsalis]
MDNVSAVRYINRLGGHEIEAFGGTCPRFLAFLSGSQHHGPGRISTGSVQCGGRLEFPVPFGPQRLDAAWPGIFCPGGFVGSSSRGSFCFSFEPSVAPFFQLASGSGGVGCGRFPSTLVSGSQLRVSSFCTDCPDGFVSPASGGDGGFDHPFLAIPALVSPAAGAVGGHPSSSAVVPSYSGGPVGIASRFGPGRVTSFDGLADFGGRESSQSLSQSARFLLAESWAPGTRAMYQSAWTAWHRWCMARDLDPVSAAPVAVVNFLSSLFDQGRAYRTINTYRSAISAGHMPVDGAPVGQCPVVCRLLRGIRFSRPPQSRYRSLWDVNLVLDFLEAWPSNEDLSLKQLSAKLTMLLCLISFRRVADVHALDLHRRSFVPEGVRFVICRRTKTNSRSVLYPAFPLRPQLCVVRCLQEYELRTVNLRCSNWPQLLISIRKPHFPVSTASLARWVRWVMRLAGIDVTLFGAHSSRGAMASGAFQAGGRLEDILRAADWSRESTFREFYFKPVSHVSNNVVMQL